MTDRHHEPMTRTERDGGTTTGDLVGSLEMKLYRHREWSREAIEQGEIPRGPVGGMKLTLEFDETQASETQVLRAAFDLLLAQLERASYRNGVEAARRHDGPEL